MIHAYDEIYLDDAMETLGSAVEYVVLFCGMDGQEFLNLFIISGLANEFGRGNVKYISGMSGIELARLILKTCGKQCDNIKPLPYVDYPPEYWVGWILAFYQWHSGKSYEAICKRISYEDVRNVYGVLHEADPSKAADVFDRMMNSGNETNLAVQRKKCGLSQSQLAKAADISIRSIQLYEQRKADIGKAQYNHLCSLAKVLGCTVDDIME